MTTQPDPARRLAEKLNDRRIALRLQWQEVADRAGISAAHLRNVRNGQGALGDLAEANLEDALRWKRGSVNAILQGGEPVEVAAVTATASLAVTSSATAQRSAPEDQTADGLEAAIRELARRLSPDRLRAILKELAPVPQGSETPTAERRYEDDIEQYLWETPGLDEVERRYLISQLDALRRLEEAKARQLAERPSAEVREFRSRG